MPASATLREMTDTGYSARTVIADVRGFQPLTQQDMDMWHAELLAASEREEREERYAERD